MTSVSFLADIFRKYPKLIILNIILAVLAVVADILSIVFLAPVVELLAYGDFQEGGKLHFYLLPIMTAVGLPITTSSLLGIFLLFSFLRAGFQILMLHAILKTKYTFVKGLIVGTFKDFYDARWDFFRGSSQGTIINTMTREMDIMGDAFGRMARLFATFIHAMIYAAVPLYISWQLTLICLAAAMIVLLPFLAMGKLNQRLGQENTETSNKISQIILENLTLAKVVLGFNRQSASVNALKESFQTHSKVTILTQTIAGGIPLLYYPFGLAVLCLAIYTAQTINIQLVETVVLIYAIFRIIPAFGALAQIKASLDSFFPSYQHILQLRNKACSMYQPSGDLLFNGLQNNITFKNVSFSYPNGKLVLDDLNFSIPKGSVVAFVGNSGVGKSTLLDLLISFNRVDTGQILIDGIDLTEINTVSYRNHLSYVPQENLLFNTTIYENMLWAKPTATQQEIEHACQQAHVHEFIEKLPHGYNTQVGDRGVRLSGGQVQRLALARALLGKPDILLLDEATNALDSQSDQLIQDSIAALSGHTTIIVVSHRTSSIINYDSIFVLKDGTLVQQGSYKELKKKPGPFQNMLCQQKLEIEGNVDIKEDKG
jgi:ATP-binding cassette, subfamily B, bacterial MsbA